MASGIDAVPEACQHARVPTNQTPTWSVGNVRGDVCPQPAPAWSPTSDQERPVRGVCASLGYDLMEGSNPYHFPEEHHLAEALEVFRTNTELFPRSWNAYDSYGEALRKAGRVGEAIRIYERSLELNPGNEGGRKALLEMKRPRRLPLPPGAPCPSTRRHAQGRPELRGCAGEAPRAAASASRSDLHLQRRPQ
jgi:tetratricopeptide (TPR) repeat protein